MKHNFLFVAALLATSVMAQTEPFKSSNGFGTLVLKNLSMYNPDGHKPNKADGVKDSIDLYVVSFGQDVYYKQVSSHNSFDGAENWRNQLDIWNAEGTAHVKEVPASVREQMQVETSAADAHWALFSLQTDGSVAYPVSAYAKMWGGNGYYSDLYAFRPQYINTPSGDTEAPTVEVNISYSGDTATVTFSNASEEVFYYATPWGVDGVEAQVSFSPSMAFAVKEGVTYDLNCYAVDFDGNMSTLHQFKVSEQLTSFSSSLEMNNQPTRVLRNGQLIICNGGVEYTAMGQILTK